MKFEYPTTGLLLRDNINFDQDSYEFQVLVSFT